MSDSRTELGSHRKRRFARVLVIAALTPIATFGGAHAAFGQASVEGYTEPGGGTIKEVPPSGEVLGEGDSGSASPGSSGGVTDRCVEPGSGSGAPGDACGEPGGGDPGTGRESGGGNPSASTGSLPFTGVDLAAIGGVGLLLAGLGFGLRRLTRAQPGS